MTSESLNRIIAIETAVPALRVSQQQALDLFGRMRPLSVKEKVLYDRFLSDNSIETRHVAADKLEEIFRENADQAHERFRRHAVALGSQALEKACAAAGLRPEMLDGIVVATCTGYLCPGLSTYLMERTSMKEGATAYDLVGHGCAAALPAIRCAQQILKAPEPRYVAVVCAEVCTAAIFFGEATDLILSNSIFSDGAAACILSNEPGRNGLILKATESLIWPQYREDLCFTQREGRLCNQLSKRVPAAVAEAVEALRRAFNAPELEDCRYAFHTGGKRILDQIETRLGLTPENMAVSRDVLRRYGNMSSASVLFILKNIMDRMDDGRSVLMFTYGAGLAAFGAWGIMDRSSLIQGGHYAGSSADRLKERAVDEGSWT